MYVTDLPRNKRLKLAIAFAPKWEMLCGLLDIDPNIIKSSCRKSLVSEQDFSVEFIEHLANNQVQLELLVKALKEASLVALIKPEFGFNLDVQGSNVKTMEASLADPVYAIVAALDCEFQACQVLLDTNVEYKFTDSFMFVKGMMGGHPVVLARLPPGRYGENSAAIVATNVCTNFPSVKCILMVGIAGGVPNAQDATKNVRLGDIVIGALVDGKQYIQWDYGRLNDEDVAKCENTSISLPPSPLLSMVAPQLVFAHRNDNQKPWELFANEVKAKIGPNYGRPTSDQDRLFQQHPDSAQMNRSANSPYIFFGRIGSGNKVVKVATVRDRLASHYRILAFEMENAGVGDATQIAGRECFFIRGICDYSDEFKNKEWQPYAAAIAAGFAKALLQMITK